MTWGLAVPLLCLVIVDTLCQPLEGKHSMNGKLELPIPPRVALLTAVSDTSLQFSHYLVESVLLPGDK